ncbi:unnamed protein product [Prunus armeniaca]|uniref:Uncharacterized protein n=1 Tax=Prunus armeniaca TaxID=36596 RepID=A0A6J5UV33_PRUAR|nr:unnamed protein product [Prunus armeniaca]CAB4309958.1 unnamed protein product [Prunus armeniaca]
MPSSSRRPCFIGASLVHYCPLLTQFVSPANSTRYFNIVCHYPLLIGEDFDLSSFGSIFVDFLTRHRLLWLVQVPDSIPRLHLVNILYVSQPEVLPTKPSLGMMSQWTCTLICNFLNLTSQHGKVSWKVAYLLFQLVIDHSFSVEFYIRDSITTTGATNASVSVEFSSLLLLMLVFLCFIRMTLALSILSK